MKLYLVRHGEAVSSNVDPKRPLSERGRQDVEKTGEHLFTLGVKVQDIWHSKKKRAAQTAKILADRLGSEVEPVQGLSPNDPVEPWVYELQRRKKDLLIVGHLPFLPDLVQALIGYRQEDTPLSLPVSSVLVLTRDAKGGWSLVDKHQPG